METLITSLTVILTVGTNVLEVLAWMLLIIGPVFLLGSAVYGLATLPKAKVATRKGYSQTEMLARAKLYEQQLQHRNDSRRK